MGSSQSSALKYVIRAKFEVEGIVERSDVIGAIFGQTEGLFGPELDFKELQRSGRIGRIEIELQPKHDRTIGRIIIPSNLDKVSTALIAASLEGINRVGPCSAKVALERIEDVRESKRKAIVERAKQILQRWTVETSPSLEELYREVAESMWWAKVEEYGPEKLSAGPKVDEAKEIIIVEGRADVINLLKCGVHNVIALEGMKIPETIIKLCKEKEATAFLDGDRGGDFILKELLQIANIRYVTRAPLGKEVEELSCKEVMEALERRVKIEGLKFEIQERREWPALRQVVEAVKELEGTWEAILFDNNMERIARLPVSELADRLQKLNGVNVVVFDGIITQRLIDISLERDIKCLIGARVSEAVKEPLRVRILTFEDVKGSVTTT